MDNIYLSLRNIVPSIKDDTTVTYDGIKVNFVFNAFYSKKVAAQCCEIVKDKEYSIDLSTELPKKYTLTSMLHELRHISHYMQGLMKKEQRFFRAQYDKIYPKLIDEITFAEFVSDNYDSSWGEIDAYLTEVLENINNYNYVEAIAIMVAYSEMFSGIPRRKFLRNAYKLNISIKKLTEFFTLFNNHWSNDFREFRHYHPFTTRTTIAERIAAKELLSNYAS